MTAQEFLAVQRRLAEAATPGPWAFAAAPAEGSDETAAEYLESALTGDGPLFVVWVPATEGEPEGYRLTAATGDGPHASMEAEFIASARTSIPKLLAAVEAVLGLHRKGIVQIIASDGSMSPRETCMGCCRVDEDEPLLPNEVPIWPCPTVRAVKEALGDDG